jgi:hypothetical protein
VFTESPAFLFLIKQDRIGPPRLPLSGPLAQARLSLSVTVTVTVSAAAGSLRVTWSNHHDPTAAIRVIYLMRRSAVQVTGSSAAEFELELNIRVSRVPAAAAAAAAGLRQRRRPGRRSPTWTSQWQLPGSRGPSLVIMTRMMTQA